MEHSFDIPPVAAVELYGFADGPFEPLLRVLFGSGEEAFADERCDGADVFLVEAEDAGGRFDGDVPDADAGAKREFAGTRAGDQTPGARVVEHVDAFGAAWPREVEGEEGTDGDATVEPGDEASASAAEAGERGRRSVEGPDVVSRDEGSIAASLLEEAGREEEREEVSGGFERRQDGREERVRNSGGAADGGEALEV